MIPELPPGWLYSNMFQLDDGTWQVNLRRPTATGEFTTQFARGDDLEDTIYACIDKLDTAEHHEDREPSYSAAPTGNLLSRLGLVRPPEPVRKRV